MTQIIELLAPAIVAQRPSLIALLQDAVDRGASIGFLPPLAADEAERYWDGVAAEQAAGARLLLAALHADRIVGAIQLALVPKPNARHRAEIQKLLVVSSARQQGLGRALMLAVELAARQAERSLLVLDTRQGDVAERLYRSLGYVEAGVIPQYARSANGKLDACVFFYKLL